MSCVSFTFFVLPSRRFFRKEYKAFVELFVW